MNELMGVRPHRWRVVHSITGAMKARGLAGLEAQGGGLWRCRRWRGRWGLTVAGVTVVVACNLLLLYFVQRAVPTSDPFADTGGGAGLTEREVQELRQSAIEARRLARILNRENQALQHRLGQQQGATTNGTVAGSADDPGSVEALINEVRDRADELAWELHAKAARAMQRHLYQLQHPPVSRCFSDDANMYGRQFRC